jgi:hypothetical protein
MWQKPFKNKKLVMKCEKDYISMIRWGLVVHPCDGAMWKVIGRRTVVRVWYLINSRPYLNKNKTNKD